MGATITIEKILNEEPYRSIVNLLAEYPDGLKLRDIQYAIMENPCIRYNISKIQEHLKEQLEEKLKQLIISGKIKKYQSKKINRQEDKPSSKKGRSIRSNLENFLKKMMASSNNVIYLENGKYKLQKSIIERLFVRSDKEKIDRSSKIEIKNLEGGRLNIYGFKTIKTPFFDPHSKENITRFKDAVKKLREGTDELQSLMNDSVNRYLFLGNNSEYIFDKKQSRLDKVLLVVLCLQLEEFFYYDSEEKSPFRWIDKVNDQFIVSRPDKKLVDILGIFFPSKKPSEINLMVKGYAINNEISMAFFRCLGALTVMKFSHIIAVVHSGSGHLASERAKPDELSKTPMFLNETNKAVSEMLVSYESSLKKQLEPLDNKLKQIMEKIRIQEPSNVKKTEWGIKQISKARGIEERLNFFKKLMDELQQKQ